MPNNFLDVTGRHDRIIKKSLDAPAQGLSIVGGDIAQKVVVSPMKAAYYTGGGTILPAKNNVRYYIHSLWVTASNTPANACTEVFVTAYIDGTAVYIIGSKLVPSVANASSNSCVVGILTDVKKSIAVTANNVGSSIVGIAYQEVFEYD